MDNRSGQQIKPGRLAPAKGEQTCFDGGGLVKSLNTRAMVHWSTSKVARIAILVTNAFAAMPSAGALIDFDDCSTSTLREVRRRIYDEKGILRPVIVTRDVAHLNLCPGLGAYETTKTNDALNRSHEIGVRRIVVPDERTPLARAFRDACAGSVTCDVEIYRRRGYRGSEVTAFAKSGGLPFAAFLGHLGVAGHYEITGRGAAAFGRDTGTPFSPKALQILQDASRDPDLYEWANPAAHAQTRNDDARGVIDQSSADAQGAFVDWVRRNLRQSEDHCRAGRIRDAIYMLGYALHAPQDLVFHEGITNAEHSFRDFIENLQIDAQENYDEKMQLATNATVDLLQGFRIHFEKVAPGCWPRIVGHRGSGALTASEKAKLLQRGKDFSIRAYYLYRDLADLVKDQIDTQTAKPEAFFISTRWLEGRNRVIVDRYIARIFDQ